MDELTSVFIQEGREQLQAMENGLLALEQNPDDHDNINGIFRAAHTIKGASGVIECHFIENFMHKVENALDRLRNGEIQVSSDLTGLLLRCCDHLGNLMGVLEAGIPTPADDVKAVGDSLQVELEAYTSPQAASSKHSVIEAESEVLSSGGGVVNTDSWHISVRFGPHMLRGGMDPLSFIRYLASLGEILALETIPTPCRQPPTWTRNPATSVSKSVCRRAPPRPTSNASSISAAMTATCASCRRTASWPNTSS
jgi:two-component system, chemotaxis family, sensor kinase CheA